MFQNNRQGIQKYVLPSFKNIKLGIQFNLMENNKITNITSNYML